MNVVCFISGSGTNYREIVAHNPQHRYLVFTNRPGCAGEAIAHQYQHDIIQLSHESFFSLAHRTNKEPLARNSPERLAFEREVIRLIEAKLGRSPDLICLAGYDLLNTDWLVERFYPRILNVHPGDTTRGYTGLHWVSAAKAILAGEKTLRSTLFFVDTGVDTGPVLIQSAPLEISSILGRLESSGQNGVYCDLEEVLKTTRQLGITSFAQFRAQVNLETAQKMERLCTLLLNELKTAGDWKIYPHAVRLIAQGRVAVDGRQVYVDGNTLPPYGLRLT
jgi:folate-dependent phosphoribosylglycinamide formyltransferase PurN